MPNLYTIAPDLTLPDVVREPPSAGMRVEATTSAWANTDVRHLLYLPRDWQPHKRLPVIVEYAGNGGFQNALGDGSDGSVESCVLGYGLSGGERYIWLCLPFIEIAPNGTKRNCTRWWGDIPETKRYCIETVRDVCKRYGGDASRVVLCGFSRGSLACNYLGLRDDEISGLWRALFCHSHYDGVRAWPYADSDAASAQARLQRLQGREVWISQEESITDVRNFIEQCGIRAPFTFVPIPYPNHSAAWVLRDISERQQARAWLDRVTR